MNQNKTETYHWENPRICQTCAFYFLDHADTIQPGCPACALHQNPTGVPCTYYSPEPVKDTI